MKKVSIAIVFLFFTITLCYSQNSTEKVVPKNYPAKISSVSNEIREKTQSDFLSVNGNEWASLVVDKFTGFLQYALVNGLLEKKNMTDYKLAVKTGDEFLKKNCTVLGIEGDLPRCVNIKGSENPQLGYVWLEYSGQVQDNLPVEGTKVVMKVDYPGVVKEVRCRWYSKIKIPPDETIAEEEIKAGLTGRSMNYKGRGGQELVYVIEEKDIANLQKVIFPLRKEKENKIEFYIVWKININKEEIKNAWTLYIDAYSGKDMDVEKNFK